MLSLYLSMVCMVINFYYVALKWLIYAMKVNDFNGVRVTMLRPFGLSCVFLGFLESERFRVGLACCCKLLKYNIHYVVDASITNKDTHPPLKAHRATSGASHYVAPEKIADFHFLNLDASRQSRNSQALA